MEQLLRQPKDFILVHKQWATLIVGVLAASSYILHVAANQPVAGWMLYAIAVGLTGVMARQAEKYLVLVVMGVGIMSITPVSTQTTPTSMLLMGVGMMLAITLPYVVSHFVYKDKLIHFNLDFRRRWRPIEIGAVVFAILSTYIFMPIYFATTEGASHWQMNDSGQIAIVFFAIMIIGMWEEFFFVAINFSILQRYLPFFWANILQAAMFAAFLYQIGFRDWVAINTFLYALYQGYIFHKFRFLLCNVIIHALVDLIVFLALFNAVFPGSVPIFLPSL